MPTPLRVLIVEDQPADAELILYELHREGFDPDWRRVETEPDYLACLGSPPDVILSDYTMPQFDGLRALHLLQEHGLDIPFIVVSGTINEEMAVECLKGGAADYLLKDRLTRLGPAVQQALQKKRLRDAQRRAEETLQAEAQVSAALVRVGRELNSSLTTPAILDRLCQVTAEVLAADISTTYLWKPAEEAYMAVAGWGETPEQWQTLRLLKMPADAIAGLRVRLDQEEVVQLNAKDIPRVLPTPVEFYQHYGVSRVVYIALRRGTQLIGVQTASYRGQAKPLTLQQEQMARGIAQIASMALENARLLEEVERANRLKSDFLAAMSHELRTPLSVIMGYVDIMLDEGEHNLTADQRRFLQRVDGSARELFELITATLDVSRLEAGRMPLEIREVPIPALLKEIEAETRELQAPSGPRWRWRVAGGLPALHTDRMKLKIVLKNLLNNASKFTEKGSITVDARSRDQGIEFCVTDTGVGIAPEVLPYIFEMFRQGDSSTTRQYGGVGLGLYIVHRLLELLGGSVTVESQVGRGTTFRVWAPLELPAARARKPAVSLTP